ncbi:hypothetical protein SOVF_101760, partial [Spinacia oleracea]
MASNKGRHLPAVGEDSLEEIEVLSQEITELKLSVDLLEKERDFYFGKPRDIEMLCQASEADKLPEAVKHKPTCVHAYLNLGNVHKTLGMPQEAVLCYQRLLQVRPDYAIAH